MQRIAAPTLCLAVAIAAAPVLAAAPQRGTGKTPLVSVNGPMGGGGGGGQSFSGGRSFGGGGFSPGDAAAIGGLIGGLVGGLASQPAYQPPAYQPPVYSAPAYQPPVYSAPPPAVVDAAPTPAPAPPPPPPPAPSYSAAPAYEPPLAADPAPVRRATPPSPGPGSPALQTTATDTLNTTVAATPPPTEGYNGPVMALPPQIAAVGGLLWKDYSGGKEARPSDSDWISRVGTAPRVPPWVPPQTFDYQDGTASSSPK